jgi:hypothetical protein
LGIMICNNCGRVGIQWYNLNPPPAYLQSSPYTKCPHCGGINCQMPEDPEEENQEEENPYEKVLGPISKGKPGTFDFKEYQKKIEEEEKCQKVK